MFRTSLLLVVGAALSAMVCGAALANEQPSPLPPFGEPKPFSLPKTETYSLRNGMKVTLAPFGSVPKVTLRAVVRVGNLNDAATPWISDLAADMMKEGAAGKTGAEIATLAARMGGGVDIGVGLDETAVAMDVLSESGPEAVALIADILQKPDFPASEYDRVLATRLRDLSVAASQPGRWRPPPSASSSIRTTPIRRRSCPIPKRSAQSRLTM